MKKKPSLYVDCTFGFQEDLKHILRKITEGIKALKRISGPFYEQKKLLLLNALVISLSY